MAGGRSPTVRRMPCHSRTAATPVGDRPAIAVAVAVSALSFGTVRGMFESPTIDRYPVSFPPGWGFSLPGVYAAWIGVVIAVYPLCRWYAAVKQRRRDWWLGYL